MRQIDNYIIEKLHLGKDTKINNLFDVIVKLCNMQNQSDKTQNIDFAQNAIKKLLSNMKDVKNLNDLSIFASKRDMKLIPDKHKEYISVNDDIVNDLMDANKYGLRIVYNPSNETPLPNGRYLSPHTIMEIYTRHDKKLKTIGIVYMRAFDESHLYCIYFVDKHKL